MPDFLREQLEASLGTEYALGRELGGGGMSRVFVAEERRFDRLVVIKVLPRDLAAGISAERFQREIALAAQLQQANIVPVLAAGEVGAVTCSGAAPCGPDRCLGGHEALPYYSMPFVDGESLGARIARGPISVTEAVKILGDVARALAYAHGRGVVHRDIKPDNVLLSGGTAVVTDFGIAKAVFDAKSHNRSGTLTQIGTALGTPAYIAPEQAAGDPDTDYRADLYSWGVMAYELLAGRHPFAHRTSPQQLLAAHMAETPPPLAIAGTGAVIPRPIVELVMRCLAKDPGARPASGAEVVTTLDALGTDDLFAVHRAFPLARALLIWCVVFAASYVLARAAIVGIGLPDWVLPWSLVVAAMGLPAIFLGAYTQRTARRASARTPTLTPGGTMHPGRVGTLSTIAMRAAPHVSWPRLVRWGVISGVAFVLAVAAVMALRQFGLGPAASLFAAGTLQARDPILVAEFEARGPDSTLGSALSEAVRADLEQGGTIAVVQPPRVVAALARMRRPAGTPLLLPVAREVAQREGIRAVVHGDVRPLGGGYLVALRLVTADSGRELASFHDAANSPRELISTLGILTRKLRGRIGESLRQVQRSQRLEDATTSSLAALQQFTAARHALYVQGDRTRFVTLMRGAIALDTNFASAYRTLAVELSNRGGANDEVARLMEHAFALRDRLPERERLAIEESYYKYGPIATRDHRKAHEAMEAQIAVAPNDGRVLDRLGNYYDWLGDLGRGEAFHRRAIAADSLENYPSANPFANLLAGNLFLQGRLAAADSLYAKALSVHPTTFRRPVFPALFLLARAQEDSAEKLLRASYDSTGEAFARSLTTAMLVSTCGIRGRVHEADRWGDALAAARAARGAVGTGLTSAIGRARRWALLRDDRAGARRVLDSALVAMPLATIPFLDRPYAALVTAYAYAGDAVRARAFLTELERQNAGDRDLRYGSALRMARADLALAERRWNDALNETARPTGVCLPCVVPRRALAYDGRGDADSAIVEYERFAKSTFRDATNGDDMTEVMLGNTWRRLGELYDAKGDVPNATRAYERFANLWRDADPELQPRVRAARARLAAVRTRAAR